MKVSVVIVNYNGKALLKIALDSINKIENIKDCEIIVVDNNSADGSIDFIKKNYPKTKIIKNKANLGYSGINSAIQFCKGKYIFFTNNDVSLDKNCIKKLMQVLEQDKSIGIASPKVINYFNRKLQSCGTWVSRSFYNGHFKCDKDVRKEIPYNGIALIRKDIAAKFGYLFDQDYFAYAEDLDLGLRTRLLGYNVMHVPEAILYHMHGHTFRGSKKYNSTYLMERNLLSTFIKTLSIKNILFFLPYIIIMRIISIVKDIFTFNFINIAARLLAILTVLINLPSLIRKRAEVQKMRKKEDFFLLQVFSEKYLFSSKKIKV